MEKIRKWLVLFLAALCIPLAVRAADIPFQAGAQLVIWAPTESKALSSTKTDLYNQAVSISLTNDELSGYGDTEVWTVSANEDGTFRFLQGGLALSLGEEYSYLRMDDRYDCWSLEATGEDRWYVKNTGRGLYLYLDTWREEWSVSDTPTALSFHIVAQAEMPTEPAPPETEGLRSYFGQLHAHTDFSDGAGTVEEAFAHAKNVANLDFFAVTDHSQSFDNAEQGELTIDGAAVSEEWARGKAAAKAATDGSFVGIFGFEMTWEQGQGHMATFGTPGFLSSHREGYESYANGMEHYYTALLEADGISMFCHPGDTFGNFKDFGSYSPALDQEIHLIETDFSGSEYDRALSLGWHLAPSASVTNHGRLWGDETSARTVVLAETLTEDSLYDAMENRRVYATEDPDLEILYRLNGALMGSEVPRSQVGETVTITAALSDPTDEALGTVDVMADGICLTSCILTTPQGEISLELPANRSYYYLRITQPDGDVALTAPIWLEICDDMGIASLETAGEVTSAGAAQTFQLALYNDETAPLEIISVTLTAEDQEYTDTTLTEIAPFASATCSFAHSFPEDGVYTVTANVEGRYNGELRQFTTSIRVIVLPAALVEDVILDGTHGNTDELDALLSLAAEQDVDIHLEQSQITTSMLESCRLLLIPTPATAFEDSFVSTVKTFVQNGGSLVLCGTSDQKDAQAAARLDRLLNEIGSTMSFLQNEARDDVRDHGDPAQIFTTVFSWSPWLEGLEQGQRYGQEWGCTIDPGSGEWLVKGEPTAYATDGGSTVLLAAEETGHGGTIFAAGCTFFADAYLSAGHGWVLPSADRTILENILGVLRSEQETIPIGQLRQAAPERIYLIEGRITAGTANPSTTFENTIYLQDGTGGIAAKGYTDHGLPLGARVQILGTLTDASTLEILRLEVLGKEDPVIPEEATCSVAYAQRGGQLLALEGTVTALTANGDAVSRFTLRDEYGDEMDILIEDYIYSGSLGWNELGRRVTVGSQIRAIGLLYLSDSEPILRIRDCDEVTLLTADAPTGPTEPETDTNPDTGDSIGAYVLLLFLVPPVIIALRKARARAL